MGLGRLALNSTVILGRPDYASIAFRHNRQVKSSGMHLVTRSSLVLP